MSPLLPVLWKDMYVRYFGLTISLSDLRTETHTCKVLCLRESNLTGRWHVLALNLELISDVDYRALFAARSFAVFMGKRSVKRLIFQESWGADTTELIRELVLEHPLVHVTYEKYRLQPTLSRSLIVKVQCLIEASMFNFQSDPMS